MFLWFPVLDLARAPRRTARKKGSGYENEGRPYIYKLELKTDHIYDDENRPYIMTENRPYIMTENRPILYDEKTLYNGNKPCIVESDYK